MVEHVYFEGGTYDGTTATFEHDGSRIDADPDDADPDETPLGPTEFYSNAGETKVIDGVEHRVVRFFDR
ncbi:hypothetical protein ACWGR4_48000 [Embleya sp. NPDC055664]